EPSRVGQEARESRYEPLYAEIVLGQEDGATGGLHEPRIGCLLVPGGSGQGDEEGGQAEIAALVDRPRPAPAHEEGGGGVDVAQLGADVRLHHVARGYARGQGAGALEEPVMIARLGIVAALMEDLAHRKEP